MMADKLENPLRAGTRVGQRIDPVSVVILGATGDLTRRKLVPALFSLAQDYTHLLSCYVCFTLHFPF